MLTFSRAASLLCFMVTFCNIFEESSMVPLAVRLLSLLAVRLPTFSFRLAWGRAVALLAWHF